MSTTLKSYLVDLATQPEQFSAYVSDPVAAATAAGLSAAELEILLSGDQNRMYAALAAAADDEPPGATRARPRAVRE